jgi:hypothetical protein
VRRRCRDRDVFVVEPYELPPQPIQLPAIIAVFVRPKSVHHGSFDAKGTLLEQWT